MAVVCLADVALGLGFAGHRRDAVALGVLPTLLVAFGALAASNRAILAFAPLALGFAYPLPLDKPLPLPGLNVYIPDLIVLLALVSWAVAWLLSDRETRPRLPRTPVLGLPFLAFAVFIVVAVVRGHEAYGAKIVSVPLRLVVYASIVGALASLTPRQAYRGIVAVFYAGAVWQTLIGSYFLATGQTEGPPADISTGGERVLAGSMAIYLSGSLLLALLNVRHERRARAQALHLAILGISTFSLVLTFQRTTFAAIGLVVPLLFLFVRRLTTNVALYLPLFVPILVALAIVLPQAAPRVLPTLTHRLTASPSNDTSARWRQAAVDAVFAQVRESPVTGVGFGREASFELNGVRVTLHQDPHDQFIYLWAGGGLLLLGSFVALLLAYLRDVWRRLRTAGGLSRLLTIWALSLWFVFVVNTASGIILTSENLLLSFWVLMLLPASLSGSPDADGDASVAKRAVRAALA